MDGEANLFDRSAAAKAVKDLSFVALERTLAEARFVDEDLAGLIELMERSGALIFRKQNPEMEARRDGFLRAFTEYVEARLGAAGGDKAKALEDLVRQVEGGYRDIEHGRRTAAISALPVERQIGAVLQRAARDGDDLRQRALLAIGKQREHVMGDRLIALDADGAPFDVDGALSSLVFNLGACLKLLIGHLHPDHPKGPVRLPALTEASEDEIYMAGTSLVSASSFRRWRRTEERRRFWGGVLMQHRPPNMPDGVAPTIEVIREFRPSNRELADWVANERLKEVMLRQFTSALYESAPRVPYAGAAGHAALPPEQYISVAERAGHKALLGLLSPEPFSDPGLKFAGLALVEWLRGYAALSAFANEASEVHKTPEERMLIRFAEGELEKRLCALGLSEDAAATFIAHATLGDRSDDMFDCPLLMTEGGGRLMFVPGLIDAAIARLVMSNLSTLGERFRDKGRSFERQVMRFFREMGFNAFTIDTHVGKEQYQMDVLVPWEKHLFLFECKHEVLSHYDPVAAHNFERTRQEHVAQILRQVEGLRRHPAMSVAAGGPDVAGMTIVPTLLYAFPYAALDPGDGVYVSDFSSLTRFFGDATVNVRVAGSKSIPVFRLWAGDRPTPDDLVQQLREPVQVAMITSLAEIRRDQLWLTDHRYALSYEWHRGAESLDKLGELLEFQPKELRRYIHRARVGMQREREAEASKLVIRQTREWREAKKRRRPDVR